MSNDFYIKWFGTLDFVLLSIRFVKESLTNSNVNKRYNRRGKHRLAKFSLLTRICFKLTMHTELLCSEAICNIFLKEPVFQMENYYFWIYNQVFQLKLFLSVWKDSCFFKSKNTLTGPANWKKTTRHYADLSLCAKSRKSNDAKLRKWPKNSIWAFLGQYIPIKNRFHSNWRPYLVLTLGQNPKKSLELFLRKISKCLILG